MLKFYSPRLFRFFTISIIAILSLVLNKITMISIDKMELPKNKPEYNMSNPNITIYESKGYILYNISSETAWQYTNSESIFLQNINAIIYESNSKKVKYQLNSNLAWLNYGKQIAYLIESSHLKILSNNESDTIDIYGKNIFMNFETKLISSNSTIKMITGKNLITSNGFLYNNKLNLLILESNVKIIYNTNNKTGK